MSLGSADTHVRAGGWRKPISRHTMLVELMDAGNSSKGFCIGFFFFYQKTVGFRLCDLQLPETLGLTALIYSHTKVIN